LADYHENLLVAIFLLSYETLNPTKTNGRQFLLRYRQFKITFCKLKIVKTASRNSKIRIWISIIVIFYATNSYSQVLSVIKDTLWTRNDSTSYKKRTYSTSGQLLANEELFSIRHADQSVTIEFRNGNTTIYYLNGKVRFNGSYKMGKPNNDWKFYDESGQLISRRQYLKTNKISKKEFKREFRIVVDNQAFVL
jgi:hypothetical protein